MAKFLSIEVEASQLRVAEIEENGRKNRILHCFCIPVPQGSVEDGQLRDTKSLAGILKKELAERGIRTKKVFFVVGSTRIANREVRIPLVTGFRVSLKPMRQIIFPLIFPNMFFPTVSLISKGNRNHPEKRGGNRNQKLRILKSSRHSTI